MGDTIVLADLGCPNCGANELVPHKDQQLACSQCGTAFGSASRLCLACGHYNDEGQRVCTRCGTELVRECSSCGADNWVLATYCNQCGRHLGIVERLARRWQQTTQQRLYERQSSMGSVKEREEWASQIRMATITDLERLGSAALGQDSDGRFLRILAVVAALLFIALVIALLVTVGGA